MANSTVATRYRLGEIIVELSVVYEEQKKCVTEPTEQLDDLRDTHFREATRQDNLYMELEERKEKLKSFKFA